MQRSSSSKSFPLGSAIPSFSLKNVDGKVVGAEYFKGAKAALVGFTCNHCPYVIGSEEMLVSIVQRFGPLGLKAVTINSNDSVQYPDDSFEKMQDKAKRMKLPYPYLHDESQEVAKLFDAACTPEFYLFGPDLKLVYHGTINDSPSNPKGVKNDYLSPAIEQVLSGKKVEPNYVHPMGCSIKWR